MATLNALNHAHGGTFFTSSSKAGPRVSPRNTMFAARLENLFKEAAKDGTLRRGTSPVAAKPLHHPSRPNRHPQRNRAFRRGSN